VTKPPLARLEPGSVRSLTYADRKETTDASVSHPQLLIAGTDLADAEGLCVEKDGRGMVRQSANFAWMLTSSVIVLLMVPALGLIYSGVARRGSAPALIWLAFISIAVVSFEWFLWGYSLTFSHTGNDYNDDLSNFGLV